MRKHYNPSRLAYNWVMMLAQYIDRPATAAATVEAVCAAIRAGTEWLPINTAPAYRYVIVWHETPYRQDTKEWCVTTDENGKTDPPSEEAGWLDEWEWNPQWWRPCDAEVPPPAPPPAT